MPVVPPLLRNSLASWGRDAAGFLYPAVCVRCNQSLSERASSQRFCRTCVDLLACRIDYACLTCGAPVGPHLETWGCRHCREDCFAFDRVLALGVYDQELKRCCQRSKDAFEAPLAAGLAELLWEAHGVTLADAEIDVVVPVPHHLWERLTRRHLPPVTLSRILARRLSIPLAPHILTKRRRTPAQSSLPPSKRRKNLKDAFRIAGGATLDGRTVLLVDDILTTGTTADQAARVLKDAGAARVLVAVVARGLGRSTAN